MSFSKFGTLYYNEEKKTLMLAKNADDVEYAKQVFAEVKDIVKENTYGSPDRELKCEEDYSPRWLSNERTIKFEGIKPDEMKFIYVALCEKQLEWAKEARKTTYADEVGKLTRGQRSFYIERKSYLQSYNPEETDEYLKDRIKEDFLDLVPVDGPFAKSQAFNEACQLIDEAREDGKDEEKPHGGTDGPKTKGKANQR